MLFAALLFPPSAAFSMSSGFLENLGQKDPAVRYYTPGPVSVYFTSEAVVFEFLEERMPESSPELYCPDEPDAGSDPSDSSPLRGCAVWVLFEGANPTPEISARGELPGRYHFFLGNDPAQWRTGVRAYGEVVYRDLWPGVDVVFRKDERGLVYEVVLSGGDSGRVRFGYAGADRVVEVGDGILIETRFGSLRHFETSVGGGWELVDPMAVGWTPAGRDGGDGLLWSTFVGGSQWDEAGAVSLDSDGNPVVVGLTASGDFPVTPGAYDGTHNGHFDVFVAKLDASGSELLWATFLGGERGDEAKAVVVDASGAVVVTGYTWSYEFPATPGAYDESFNGVDDAFVVKLSPSGSELVWSTFLGGDQVDHGRAVSVDGAGNVIVTGHTLSGDFPVTEGAYDGSFNGEEDAFVTKIDRRGRALLWSTYFGGSSRDFGLGVTVDGSGDVLVVGYTASENFPVTAGVYDESFNGDRDVFVARFAGSEGDPIWSTFVGGMGGDIGRSVVLGPWGNVVFGGGTESVDFPVTRGAYDASFNGGWDIFVGSLDSSGSLLLWATYLGGTLDERNGTFALDRFGNPVVTGTTCSLDYPTTRGAQDGTYDGFGDVCVAKLDALGAELLWSTYLGGPSWDDAYGVAVDAFGNPVVTGSTSSSNFPTTPGAYDESFNGTKDVFVTKLFPGAVSSVGNDLEQIREDGVRVVPNPVVWGGSVRFRIGVGGPVRLRIFDPTGGLVRELWKGSGGGRIDEVVWDGRDGRGVRVGAGVYFYTAEVGGQRVAGRVVLVR
jgi:hypothetical protein